MEIAFLKIFLGGGCGTFLKSLLNLLQYCSCFMFFVLFFGHEACCILALQPEIEPAPPALKGKVLTTGPLRKHLEVAFNCSINYTRIIDQLY